MSNLIDNAIHYCPRGATVTVRVASDGRMARLMVEDNGPGLGDDELAHAFERFWRGSDLPGGCGLGLPIVAEIARRHGGGSSLRQMQPNGLCVEIVIPLQG